MGIEISVKQYKTAKTIKKMIPETATIPLITDLLISIKNTPFSDKIYLLFPFDRYILTDQVCHKTDFTFLLPAYHPDYPS